MFRQRRLVLALAAITGILLLHNLASTTSRNRSHKITILRSSGGAASAPAQTSERRRWLRSRLASLGRTGGCKLRFAGEAAEAEAAPAVGGRRKRVFYGANLYNNAPSMAHWLVELLQSVAEHEPADAFVSVYESGSTDATPRWLAFLADVLAELGVPFSIVSNATDVKAGYADRIEFMAHIRNQILRPLHEGFAQPAGGAEYDKLVLMNDVFFCARDVRRLLALDADLACGLDFDNVNNTRKAGELQPLIDRGVDVSRMPLFYDVWVARGIDGARFSKLPPYVSDAASVAQAHGGKPFRVYCCWNGIAVLRAAPFLRGLRFRALGGGSGGGGGECSGASECSFMCKDLWNSGYTRVMVDPMVRLAYDRPTFESLQQPISGLDDVAPTASVAAAASAPPKSVTCCPRAHGWDRRLYWSKCYAEPTRSAAQPKLGPAAAGGAKPRIADLLAVLQAFQQDSLSDRSPSPPSSVAV